MSLKSRAEKSKQLEYTPIPGAIAYATDSSSGHYQVILRHYKGEIPIGNELVNIPIVSCSCYKIRSIAEDCKGNSYNTICYHCLGAIMKLFEEQEQEELIFCDNAFNALAIRLQEGGRLVQIVSAQGEARIWAVGRKSPIKELREAAEKAIIETGKLLKQNTNDLRGSKEEQNGID